MSRRSPFNKHYQNNESTGSTRKSAASAKIKRANSSAPKSKKPQTRREKLLAQARTRQAKGSGSGKSGAKAKGRVVANPVPDTPEYRRLRRLWWILLAVAAVALVIALVLTSVTSVAKAVGPMGQNIGFGFEILAIILLVATWLLDFKKIRPLIKQAQRDALPEKKKH